MKTVRQVMDREGFLALREEAMQVFASDAVLDYIARIAMASREDPALEIGLSPRAAICLDRMAKVRAWMDGRDYVVPQDVQNVALDVCAHRVIPAQKSRLAGLSEQEIVRSLMARVRVPDRHA
jgi:MoxR-like ATPase